ncbi:MAG: lamin tail domain-containing protein [Candidatus Sungbacteria bacterium]|nr:lamin tail domain-containing protein [Candidatus Sungbacteria bacterium]
MLLPIFVFPLFVSGAGVVINEVLFDPAGTDTGFEAIELYNSEQTSSNLSGWQLYPDGIGYFVFPSGFTVGSHQTVVVHLHASGTPSATDLYHPNVSGNMGNAAGSVALFSQDTHNKDTIKSFVQWGRGGETWEPAAVDAGLWDKGAFVATTSSDGRSIALTTDGVTDGEVRAWRTGAVPTLGAPNNSASVPQPSPTATPLAPPTSFVQPPQASSITSQPAPSLTIRARITGPGSVMMGSRFELLANAEGLLGAPLAGAKFWWNFGDGKTGEGKSVEHVFAVPGRYLIGLHVSSGEYTAAEYLGVDVMPNKFEVLDVIPGERGFIRLANNLDSEIDLGGWVLEDVGGARFFIPPQTKIAAHASMALPNATTGLLAGGDVGPITFRYANGDIAFSHAPVTLAVPVLSSNKEPVNALPERPPEYATTTGGVPRASQRTLHVAGIVSQSNKKPAIASVSKVRNSGQDERTDAYHQNKTANPKQPPHNNGRGAGRVWIFFLAAFGFSVAGAVGFLLVRML